jgi:TPR repeat protein
LQFQDWIVLLHTPDQLLFDTNTRLAYNLAKQAVYWYQKAADQGQAKAQYNLGVMYANGVLLPAPD